MRRERNGGNERTRAENEAVERIASTGCGLIDSQLYDSCKSVGSITFCHIRTEQLRDIQLINT